MSRTVEGRAVTAHDAVNYPAHYTHHPSGVELIAVTRYLPFTIGSALECVLQAGLERDRLEDLRRARWYLADAFKEFGEDFRPPKGSAGALRRMVDCEPDAATRMLLRYVENGRTAWMLDMVNAMIHRLDQEAEQ